MKAGHCRALARHHAVALCGVLSYSAYPGSPGIRAGLSLPSSSSCIDAFPRAIKAPSIHHELFSRGERV